MMWYYTTKLSYFKLVLKSSQIKAFNWYNTVYMLPVSLVFHTIVPLIDLNNVKTEHKPPFYIFRHPCYHKQTEIGYSYKKAYILVEKVMWVYALRFK